MKFIVEQETFMTRYIFYAAALYSLFVIYGSLVPLHYRYIALNDALNQFKNIRYLNLGIGSLADWVANILLMVPLAFLWFLLLTKNARLPAKIFLFIFVWLACFLLAMAIEFTQLFFPPRTVSINDIIAEGLGSFIGCITGWFFGYRLIAWIQQWYLEADINSWDRYLQIYLFGLFLYAVLPLDLTLSPVEIYHKWNEGRVTLLPFGNLKTSFVENIYQWGSEALLWLPVPLLWQRTHRLTRFQLYQRLFLASLVIEFFQLFVYSRVTDTTDILLALLGGGIGIQLIKYFSDASLAKPTQTRFQTILSGSVCCGVLFCLVWSVLLMSVFWYPFNFDIDSALISERKYTFFKIPFYSYYYGTEFRAITEVFHKILFFIPLGIALAFISWDYRFRSVSRFVSYFWIALTALGIEFGQILLPKKNADLTDWVLEVTGGIIGYVVSKQLLTNQYYQKSTHGFYSPSIAASSLYGRTEQETPAKFRHYLSKYKVNQMIDRRVYDIKTPNKLWIMLVIGVSILALILHFLSKLSFIPYNVRELISGQYPWLRHFGLSSMLFWCLGFPVWFLARILASERENLWYCWTGVGVHSIVALALIRLSAPLESIHDIVGSSTLTIIPAELELFLRLMAFFGIFSLLLFGAVMMANSLLGCYSHLFKYYVAGFVSFIILLPIYYWGVVLEAGTDNIIELLPDEGRSWWIVLIALYILLFTFIGSACSALLALKQWHKLIWILLGGFISYPLGYLLIQWGTEQFILKYGVVFSAMQFLFSADRNHYVLDESLKLRFYSAHTALILMIVITQFPQWLAIPRQQKIKVRPR
jgi:VanZ family protein